MVALLNNRTNSISRKETATQVCENQSSKNVPVTFNSGDEKIQFSAEGIEIQL